MVAASGFLDSTPLLDSPEALRARLAQHSYVWLRGVLPSAPLRQLRLELLAEAEKGGWLRAGTPLDAGEAEPSAACVEPEPRFRTVYDRAWCLESFHRLPHHPALISLIQQIVGGDVLVHPRPIIRMIFPHRSGRDDFTTPPHQDYPHIQGTPETYTVWIPLSDCPRELGPLTVAAGSHAHGVYDFRLALGAGGLEVVDPLDGRWVEGDFALGDVLVFHSMTVHKALPNRTSRLRLSVDFRYQHVEQPINSECLKMDWESLYRTWQGSEELRYFWHRRPLKEVPFDTKYHDRRDQLALAAGRSGDRRAISTLQRVAVFARDASLRDEARALLDALGAPVPAQTL